MLRNAEKAYVLGEISNTTAIRTLCGKSLGSVCHAEVTQPVYSKDFKTLADGFNAFFASVGSNVSEASKSLAAEADLPVLTLPIAPEDA